MNISNLNGANQRRQQAGAAKQVEAVQAALRVLSGEIPQSWREAGNIRLSYPNDSLTQLGARAGITKDAFAGRLVRLTRKAERLREARP